MSENYEIYESRHRRSKQKKSSRSGNYKKRLKKQIIFSVVCLLLIYFAKISNSVPGSFINANIKYALEFKIDTEKIQHGITSMLDKIVK